MDIQVNILPDLTNFTLQLIATLILFLVLRAKLFTPLKNLLEKRAQTIESEISVAKVQKQEAEQLKAKYELNLENAKEEARGIVDSAKKRGDQLKDEILSEARSEAEVISTRAKNDIEREREKALDSVKSEVADIAVLVASKVMNKNLDETTHKEMIDKFISEVGESKWQS